MLAAETRTPTAAVGAATNLNPEPPARNLRPGVAPVAWKQIVEPLEPFLQAVAKRLEKQIEEFEPAIAPYAEYALTGQGKQLRPALVALSAGATGEINDTHITVAVIIEMVHLATLVHDDVMDEAEIRRGRLTLAANWGNEIAVLFGDCLFAHALKLAASFPTPEICRAVAMATNTVCSGEILQTQQRRNFQFSRKEYFKVLEMKTAELFALSCDLGACLSRFPGARRNALRRFGLALGTAYQVYDDCLDLYGSEAVVGKSLGTDLAKGKLTLPLLLLWERADRLEREELQELIQQWESKSFPRILELLNKHETRNGSLEVIRHHLEKARQTLSALPGSESRTGLIGLTEYLARQAEILGANGL
ncbi:MAG: polyprenyl synthetase family protein [Verrucomicrobia bacterium]|nr:polyprenyl synthetase family protein [Verrucomicrobiota bacterium]